MLLPLQTSSEYLGYKAISDMTNDMISDYSGTLQAVMIGVKALAVVFVLLNWLKEYLDGLKSPEKHRGITPYSLVVGILFIALISNFNVVSDYIDKMLGAYEESFSVQATDNIYNFTRGWIDDMEEETIQEEETFGESVMNTASSVVGSIVSFFRNIGDIWWWIYQLLKGIAWFINALLYPVYLLERGFLLLVMKFAMPLILALGTVQAYRQLVKKWILLYCAVFVSGLFLMLATNFCDATFAIITRTFGLMDNNDSQSMLFLVVVFAKAKLYKAAVEMSYKLFNA